MMNHRYGLIHHGRLKMDDEFKKFIIDEVDQEPNDKKKEIIRLFAETSFQASKPFLEYLTTIENKLLRDTQIESHFYAILIQNAKDVDDAIRMIESVKKCIIHTETIFNKK